MDKGKVRTYPRGPECQKVEQSLGDSDSIGMLGMRFTEIMNGKQLMTDNSDSTVSILERLELMQQQLHRIEKQLSLSATKESYTTAEVAERVRRTEWTVRQWCSLGRVSGAKKVHGRGRRGEWRISHEELVRLQNEGPLPVSRTVS